MKTLKSWSLKFRNKIRIPASTPLFDNCAGDPSPFSKTRKRNTQYSNGQKRARTLWFFVDNMIVYVVNPRASSTNF